MLFNASSEESQMNAITVKISKFRHLPFPPSVWEAHIMLIPTKFHFARYYLDCWRPAIYPLAKSPPFI